MVTCRANGSTLMVPCEARGSTLLVPCRARRINLSGPAKGSTLMVPCKPEQSNQVINRCKYLTERVLLWFPTEQFQKYSDGSSQITPKYSATTLLNSRHWNVYQKQTLRVGGWAYHSVVVSTCAQGAKHCGFDSQGGVK